MMRRWLGVPFLYAAASAAVGFSIYFSIGVVADRGLGLTPVIFLLAGLTGLLMRQLLEGETPDEDLEPFAPDRFWRW